jgi:oligosaccharide reducing-end xylanase
MKKTAYRNIFAELGKTDEEINAKIADAVHEFFYGENRLYYETDDDMAYIEDTGNNDARTEGMSYGMMMCVQLDMKPEFDRLWKWSKKYMFMTEGDNEGYFAWSCRVTGEKNAYGPAPDGEEFFAMALFFASARWGDGEGIFNYSREARELLHACIHKGENGRPGAPMWNHDNKLILFGPGCDFTDASYHLPHFYTLFAERAYEEDREFWEAAAAASREYLAKACHPVSGMNPEYGEFDGSPMSRKLSWMTEPHDRFFSDSYRTAANIGLDYEWFGVDAGQCAGAARLRDFLDPGKADICAVYDVDGTPLGEPAKHPLGLISATAQSALAAGKDDKRAAEWAERFWNEPMRTGKYRYYDNCLYMFALLALSGNYRIY